VGIAHHRQNFRQIGHVEEEISVALRRVCSFLRKPFQLTEVVEWSRPFFGRSDRNSS
jgi:hypothetical protein